MNKAETWLRRCTRAGDDHAERCEVGLVLRNCDILGETVETEFERIQNWYPARPGSPPIRPSGIASWASARQVTSALEQTLSRRGSLMARDDKVHHGPGCSRGGNKSVLRQTPYHKGNLRPFKHSGKHCLA